MPLKEWAKKHIRKKSSTDQLAAESNESPSFKVYRSDTMGVTPLEIPDTPHSPSKRSFQDPSPSTTSDKSPKSKNRLSLLGARHRSASQNSLPDWTPPDESDPNAERDWEARATKLARLRPVSLSTSQENLADLTKLSVKDDAGFIPARVSADGHLIPQGFPGWAPVDTVDGLSSDDALQEAIRLHEAGSMSI